MLSSLSQHQHAFRTIITLTITGLAPCNYVQVKSIKHHGLQLNVQPFRLKYCRNVPAWKLLFGPKRFLKTKISLRLGLPTSESNLEWEPHS